MHTPAHTMPCPAWLTITVTVSIPYHIYTQTHTQAGMQAGRQTDRHLWRKQTKHQYMCCFSGLDWHVRIFRNIVLSRYFAKIDAISLQLKYVCTHVPAPFPARGVWPSSAR